VTAASCTTNCLAPVVKVVLGSLGITHGCITTIHDVTNTQTIVDAPNSKKSDLRRARSSLLNLAPTSTGSATAIALIFPELKGKLNGEAPDHLYAPWTSRYAIIGLAAAHNESGPGTACQGRPGLASSPAPSAKPAGQPSPVLAGAKHPRRLRTPALRAGLAVRVPLLNASLTDCVFEVKRPTTAEEVNRLLKVRPTLAQGTLPLSARHPANAPRHPPPPAQAPAPSWLAAPDSRDALAAGRGGRASQGHPRVRGAPAGFH
jgi:hypothetical protein